MHLSVDGEPLGELSRVQLQPGDVLVLSTSDRISIAHMIRIKASLGANFPGHEVAIISDGFTLDVVAPAKRDVTDDSACPHGRLFGCAICLLDAEPGDPINP